VTTGVAVARETPDALGCQEETVLNKNLVTCALVALTGSGVLLTAQAPSGNAPPAPAVPPAQTPARPTATPAPDAFVGCVYHEKDLQDRAPNPAERAGLGGQFVLAEVPSSPIAAARAAAPGDAPGTTPSPIGTSGTSAPVYRLQLVDADKLKTLVGRRVEVVGRVATPSGDHIDASAARPGTPADRILGPERSNIVELDVTSIREVAGTCPQTPDPRP
jgi:hypothetical protein